MVPIHLPVRKSRTRKRPVPAPNEPSLQGLSGEMNYHVEFNRAQSGRFQYKRNKKVKLELV